MIDVLSTFATAVSASEQLEALRTLAQTKDLPKVTKDERFSVGLNRLAQATASSTPEDRLHALAALGRVWSSVKALRSTVEQLLSSQEIGEPASLSILDDSDDREYVAHACRHLSATWVADYVAKSAANEEAAEKARTQCIETLLYTTDNLADSIGRLAGRLTALSFPTERPEDSMGRRVRRVLSSLHDALVSHPTIAADNAGRELASLLHECFRRVGIPRSEPLRRELLAASAHIVHDIVRVRFSQATNPVTYEVLEVLRPWFRQDQWNELSQTAAVRAIADDAVEAISLLSRAGVTDNRLRRSLAAAVGSDLRSDSILKQLAESLSGLSVEVRRWLAKEELTVDLDVMAESAARNLDAVIADVFIRRDQFDRLLTSDPEHGALVRLLIDSFLEMARARSLELAYSPGEIVDYSPLDHELVGGTRQGIRRVVVVEPQVRARQSSGGYRVVRKALVRTE